MALQFIRHLLKRMHGSTAVGQATVLRGQSGGSLWRHPTPQTQAPALAVHDQWSKGDTLIAKDACFKGVIAPAAGTLTIQGCVEGTVQQQDGSSSLVVVAPGAKLTGTAEVARLHVYGELDAVVDATSVFIDRTATTRGRIAYSDLHIVKGGNNKVGLVHR